MVSVSGRSVPLGAVAGREQGGRLGVQARGGVASGGVPLRADPLLRRPPAQRLQDHRGGPGAAVRDADGWFVTSEAPGRSRVEP